MQNVSPGVKPLHKDQDKEEVNKGGRSHEERQLPGGLVSKSIAFCSSLNAPMHYVHFVKYDDTVSFYDAVSDTIRRRGGDRGIFTEEGVDTVAYFGGNHGSRV